MDGFMASFVWKWEIPALFDLIVPYLYIYKVHLLAFQIQIAHSSVQVSWLRTLTYLSRSKSIHTYRHTVAYLLPSFLTYLLTN